MSVTYQRNGLHPLSSAAFLRSSTCERSCLSAGESIEQKRRTLQAVSNPNFGMQCAYCEGRPFALHQRRCMRASLSEDHPATSLSVFRNSARFHHNARRAPNFLKIPDPLQSTFSPTGVFLSNDKSTCTVAFEPTFPESLMSMTVVRRVNSSSGGVGSW